MLTYETLPHFPTNGAHIVTFPDPQHRPLIANGSSSHLLLLPTTRRPPGSRVFAYVELYLWGERRGIEICFELPPVRREQDGEFEYQQVPERIVWGPCGSTKAKTFATTRSTMPSTPEGSAAFTGLFPSPHSILGSPQHHIRKKASLPHTILAISHYADILQSRSS